MAGPDDQEEEKKEEELVEDISFVSPEVLEARRDYQQFLNEKISEFKALLRLEFNEEEMERPRLNPDRFKEFECIGDAIDTFECALCDYIVAKPVSCSLCKKIFCKPCIQADINKQTQVDRNSPPRCPNCSRSF